MAVYLIPLGTPTPIIQNVVYALPSRASFIFSDSGVEVSQSLAGPWSSLSSGTRTAASFIRCMSGNTVVTAKSSARTVGGGASLTYAAKVAADGATNYWRLNETSGLSAVDSIGGANGTISGGVTLNQAGAVAGGKSMLFNGTTGQIVSAINLTFPLTVTYEAWVKTTIFSQQTFLSGGGNIQFVTTNGHLMLYSDPLTVNGIRTFNDGAWHHVVAVLTGTTVTFYVDGTIDTSGAMAQNAQLAPAYIGTYAIYGNWWTGYIAEVAIYPRALTPAEISAHYALR